MDNRENIFTSYVRDINDFCNHKITKEDLFKRFVYAVEIATDEERNARLNYEQEFKYFHNQDLTYQLTNKLPYSSYADALESLQ